MIRRLVAGVVLMALALTVRAADNELTDAEKADGWQLLFNGKDFTGWKTNTNKPIGSKIEDGCLQPHDCGGYILMYDKPFGDFEFKCDVKMSGPPCNSGIFFRVGSPRNPIYTGLEAQVEAGPTGPMHAFGSIYDLVPVTKNVAKPPGEWNHYEILCKGPLVVIKVNGAEVSRMNCDEFNQRGKRPDGSRHKFFGAIKDFPRSGYLGFQDHGQKVWFKNVKIRELKS